MPQEIIFTALPHQRTTVDGKDTLKLSVFASIKLSTPKDTTLGTFEDIMAWPQKILDADFKFRLQNGTVLDPSLMADKIDVDLFGNILHEDIKVDDFKEEDLSKKQIYSFPVKHIQDFILKSYRQEATVDPKVKVTPDKFVDETNLGAISPIKLDPKIVQEAVQPKRNVQIRSSSMIIRQQKQQNTRTFRGVFQQQKRFTPFAKQMNPKTDFHQLRQFHQLERQKPTFNLKIEKPSFEFHDILATVNSYPQIMRKLALVLDFNIPYDSSIPNKGTIQLVPDGLVFDEEGTTVSTPTTAYEITNSGFYIGDKTDSIFKQGFVKINTDEFSVIQVDADGAALKTTNMTENKVHQIARFYAIRSELALSRNLRTKELEDVEPPEDEGLPFMRSAGIAVTKNGMAEHLFKRIETNIQLKQNFVSASPNLMQIQPKPKIQGVTPQMVQIKVKEPTKILYSDDVIQAYQMDIAYEDDPEKWFSLHQRKDEYTWFDEQNNPHPIDGIDPDEGFIQLGIAENPENPDDVFVSETLARWEGWSLSVRKPGYAINEAEDYQPQNKDDVKRDFVNKDKAAEAKKYAFDPDLDFKINAQSKSVPGTLPKLRFGRDYRVRIRAVDLAGNSVPLDS
ncbi:MAG TPA: hypothetical protein VKA27_05950, partial [Sunxiuqinia sp.]|nr:hypothetical protein [Sunxiuqinia sp.]